MLAIEAAEKLRVPKADVSTQSALKKLAGKKNAISMPETAVSQKQLAVKSAEILYLTSKHVKLTDG